MSRAVKIVLFLLLVLLAGVTVELCRFLAAAPGAREAPGRTEEVVARRLRSWAIPRDSRVAKNPFAASPQLLLESRNHFADHCASCHSNDGSGNSEMGRNLYPRVPDMRLAATQQLSDGELYYIIHNGVRLTGMPAWGEAGDDPDSWKLVLFIRHLPNLTSEEIRDMERLNPKSAMDREEEEQEQKFLNGESAAPAPHKH
jgi:cytochrome c553